VPGAPASAELDADEYTGDLYFPSEILDHDTEEANRDAYDTLLQRVTAGPGDERVFPEWGISVDIEFVRTDGGRIRAILTVENTSAGEPRNEEGRLHHTMDRDTTLFDVTADIETSSGEFVNFTFDRLEEDFRYDRSLPGRGTNCIVTKPNPDDASHLRTEYLPVHRQRRYVPRMGEDMERGLDLTFETLQDLENGGLEALEDIRDEMWDYLENQDHGYDQALAYHYEKKKDFTEDDRRDFNEDREAFRKEILRVERAIACLRADLEHEEMDGQVVRSFELMNQTFGEAQDYPGWRPFQLVFILRVLPDLVSREYDEWSEVPWREGDAAQNYGGEEMEALDLVDIVWFPTGGGKTEAYLGLGVFAAVFGTTLGLAAAYTLVRSRLRAPVRGAIGAVIALPLFVPTVVVAFGIGITADRLGIGFGLLPVAFGHLFWVLPFSTFLIAARYGEMNPAFSEAARDLGADRVAVFRTVTLPLLLPALVASALFCFALSFNEFLITFFLSGSGTTTVPLEVFGKVRVGATSFLNAASVIVLLIGAFAAGTASAIREPT
jgi:spermidine/putrescine transport system permease protein